MSIVSELLIILRGQDQASGAISKVNSETKLLKDATSGLGLGAVAAYGSAGLAIGTFMKVGIGELMEAQKVTAQTEAALKSTGGAAHVTAQDIDDLASSVSDMAAIDDELVQSAENVLLTFTNVRNEVGAGNQIFDRAIVSTADLSARLGGDLQGSVLMLGKALNDPIAGMTALSRAGVQFSDAQKEMIRTLVESGDLLDAQKLILKEVETQVGGSAKAYGETLPGEIDRAQVKFENFAGSVMEITVPAMVAVIGVADDTVTAIQNVVDAVDSLPAPGDGGLFGFFGDALDAVPDEAKAAAAGMGMIATASTGVVLPVIAVKEAIDHLSDSEKENADATREAVSLLEQMGSTIHSLTTDTDQYVRGIAESSSRLWEAPQAALAVQSSLKGLATEAHNAASEADAMSRAFYDALNQPSPERKIRSALLDQAEFNVARLQQQVDAGMGDVASGVGDATKSEYLDWLKNDFIPAQEEWLKLDQLKTDANVSSAEAMKAMGQDERDFARFQRGELLPNQKEFNSSVYTTKDALDNAGAAFDYIKTSSPLNVKVTADVPTKNQLNRAISNIDPTETVKVGMEAKNRISGISAVIQATDPTETVKVGMEAKNRVSGVLKVIQAADPTETIKVGMEGVAPSLGALNRTVYNAADPTETFKVGMVSYAPSVATLNAVVIAAADPTETFKVGMNSYVNDDSLHKAISDAQQYLNDHPLRQEIRYSPEQTSGARAGASPFGIAATVLPGGVSGITYNQTFTSVNQISGVFLGSPDQIASFVRDYIMPEIRREWGR